MFLNFDIFFIYFSGNCPFPRLIIEADDQAPIYYNKKQINNRMTNQIWLIYYSGFRFHTFAPVCICSTVSVVVYCSKIVLFMGIH